MRIKYVLNTICIIILNDKILVPNIYNNDITNEINKSSMMISADLKKLLEHSFLFLFYLVGKKIMVCKTCMFYNPTLSAPNVY